MITILVVTCSLLGTGGMTAPDNACTPGAYERLTRAQVCTHRDRPVLHDRRQIVESYGVPNWSGRDGELDHRVPFFLGGLTNVSNVWPEPGSIPNQKDRLETYSWRRVCFRRPYPMRVSTARRIFRRDWRTAYLKYHLGASTKEAGP